MWSSSHLHAPRRSHEQSRVDLSSSESSSPDDGTEPRKRTSSDATPRPTPATTRFLNASSEQDTSRNVFSSLDRSDGFGSTKRLGFFADKLTSSLSGTGKESTSKGSLHPGHLLHPHSRMETNQSGTIPSLSAAGSAVPSAMSGSIKSHTSPSKVMFINSLDMFLLTLLSQSSYGRTYDPKLVQREMHRLGNLAHLPSALAPQLSSAPSVSSISLPSQGNISQLAASLNATTDPWATLHVHVLPLFNGEPLRVPMQVT